MFPEQKTEMLRCGGISFALYKLDMYILTIIGGDR